MLLAFDFPSTAAGIATLITAIAGFIAVIFRQQRTEQTVDKVYKHVNGVDEPPTPGEPLTLGQEVRQINDRMARIERELGIKDGE